MDLWQIVSFTLEVALVSTAILLPPGLVTAWALSKSWPGKTLVEALVTLEEGTDPAEASALVRSALRTTEVPAHMIPKRVHVVDELPLLGIGKVDRAAARRLAGG